MTDRLDATNPFPRRSGIYLIRCLANGKRYVGSADILRKRLNAHRNLLRLGSHHSVHMQRTWNKYGESSFEYKVLLFCDRERLLYYEQRALDILRPELNITRTAGSLMGMKTADATRAKLSTVHKAKHADPEFHEKAVERLKKLRKNEEFEEARREGHRKAMLVKKARGDRVPEEVRQKIRKTKREVLKKYAVMGEMLCLPEIREKYGITVYTFRARLNRGWDIDRAATEAVKVIRKQGETRC